VTTPALRTCAGPAAGGTGCNIGDLAFTTGRITAR
jgi:hypothetical protein